MTIAVWVKTFDLCKANAYTSKKLYKCVSRKNYMNMHIYICICIHYLYEVQRIQME
jgi:hypothetical protein